MATSDEGLWCIVPAAGRGSRFGGDVPKQYVDVAGKPLLLWTLERLARHPRIAGLLVALAADDAFWPGLTDISGKPVVSVIGGGERADSVLAGLLGLPAAVPDDAFVLVHDAARPCVRSRDIDALIDRGIPAGGGLLAAPLRDTLKRADAAQRVAATEPRESRWRALTPQMFRRGELTISLQNTQSKGIVVTDEAMAMELAGFSPLLVEGSDDNLKITTPADRVLAEYLLRRLGAEEASQVQGRSI
jgi:2-C-methyl-D-erythritol 4-phosphate cytidylyltransferase